MESFEKFNRRSLVFVLKKAYCIFFQKMFNKTKASHQILNVGKNQQKIQLPVEALKIFGKYSNESESFKTLFLLLLSNELVFFKSM